MTLGKLLWEISALVNANLQLGFSDRYESIVQEYVYMLDFMSNGYKDDKREELYDGMYLKATMLRDDIQKAININKEPYLDKLNVKIKDVDCSTSALIERLCSEVEADEKIHILSTAFNAILLSPHWKEQDTRLWLAYLMQADNNIDDACTIVSAIMLACNQWFDIEKLKTLVYVYQMSDKEVLRQRALVGWAMCVNLKNETFRPQQLELLSSLAEDDERVGRDIIQLFMQMVICSHTEEDTDKLEKELMPKINKGQAFQISIENGEAKANNLEDFLEQSQSEEAIEEMEEGLKKVRDMQESGADLFFKGFRMMKRFPFFYRLSNWFMPFTDTHPEIQDALTKIGKMKFIERVFADGPFCDSDKYSFVFAIMHVIDSLPEQVRKMMENGDLAPIGTLDENDTSRYTDKFIRRIYLQDLYRFFKLFPQYKFNDIFTKEGTSYGIIRYLGDYAKNHADELASFLMRRGEYANVQSILDILPSSPTKCMLYGAWNYKMGNYSEAYSHYRQAISLNPENNKAQLGLARSASRLGKHNEAAAAYDILKTNAPENISYALNYVIAEASDGKAEEMVNEAYRLDFEQNNNIHIKRVLAWVLLLAKRPEQAMDILQSISNGEYGKPQVSDVLNLSYGMWVTGKTHEAIEEMARYINMLDKKVGLDERFQQLYDNMLQDIKLLELYGLNKTAICIMIDSVRLKSNR